MFHDMKLYINNSSSCRLQLLYKHFIFDLDIVRSQQCCDICFHLWFISFTIMFKKINMLMNTWNNIVVQPFCNSAIINSF